MLRTVVGSILGGTITLIAACGSEQEPSQFGTSSGSGDDGGTSSGILGGNTDAGPPPPPIECRKMDIVFVIDNSVSMTEEQLNLVQNFPGFFKTINEYKTAAGELLEYRIAITSTDDQAEIYDKGKFRTGRGQDETLGLCDPGPNEKPWLERTDGDVAKHFECRGRLGVKGSNVERPLEAARLSVTDRLNGPLAENKYQGESFIRPDALLAFVILSDEDEGGGDNTQPPPAPLKDASKYAADFDAVKQFRGRWAAAVIAGKEGCHSEKFGDASKAVRLQQFVSTVGENGVFSDICQGDLTKGLQDALNTFTAACKAFPGIK
jgi:hypothetical protein